MISAQKDQLRKQMFEFRKSLGAEQRKRSSENVCKQLIDLVKENNLKSVHCFIPIGNEIDVRSFIDYCLAQSIIVVCPKTLKKNQLKHLILSDLASIENGGFGTVYPKGENEFTKELDLIIVPGLAYDNQGGRLGYGGGYYDTFLATQPNAFKVGVGFQCQLIAEVPMEEHDVRLDRFITG